jgi:hypothetical protein
MPLNWFINIFVFFSLLFGLQEFWVGLWNRSPVKLSCAQYLAKPVSGDWLELSDCHVNYLETLKTYRKGRVSDNETRVAYFAPVRPTDDPAAPVRLLVRAPEDVVSKLAPLFASGGEDSTAAEQQQADAVLAKHAALLIQNRTTVKGTVQSGLKVVGEQRELIEKDHPASWKLATEWRVLDESEEPSVLRGLIIAVVSALVLAWRIARFLRRRAEVQAIEQAEVPEKIADLASRRE